MSIESPVFGLLLGITYGGVLAGFAHFSQIGKWMSTQAAWLLYTYGAIGAIFLMLLLIDNTGALHWRDVACLLGGSLLGIQILGVYGLYNAVREIMLYADKDEATQQDFVDFREGHRQK